MIMDPLIYVSVAVVIVIILFLLYFLTRTSSDHQPAVAEAPVRDAVQPVRGAARRRHVQRNNHTNRLRHVGNDSDEDEAALDDDEDEMENLLPVDGKVGAKKLRKLQEKEEKRKQREAELQEREEKKKREAALEEKRKKDEAQDAALRAIREEEERKKKEELEKQEYEKYLKLKQSFVVEEEGTEEASTNQDAESLLQDFLNYIEDVKVVMLEDLAAHFRLKTQDCIDRVKTLMEEGRLSGVMDDRGKFIHITKEEYESVAKFIKQRGRISIGELVESSNRLIRLVPESDALRKTMIRKELVVS